MALLPLVSWDDDAIHDLKYHRLLLSFKEPSVQQNYVEDRTRRYRPVRNKVHAGVCIYLALFAGHAAFVHEFRTLYTVFAIFFAIANAGICCASFLTNYFISHSRLRHLSNFVSLTMLVCGVLWATTSHRQQNVVFAVSAPTVLTLFNITSRTAYLQNFGCLVLLSAVNVAGLALHGTPALSILEAVVSFVLLAVIAYEVEHVTLQDFTTMQTMDTLIRRPSDLGSRSSRGDAPLEGHTVQAVFTLAQLITTSLAASVGESKVATGGGLYKPRKQGLWPQSDALSTPTRSLGRSSLSATASQSPSPGDVQGTGAEQHEQLDASPSRPFSPTTEDQRSPASASRSASDDFGRYFTSDRGTYFRLLKTYEMGLAMVHYLRAVRGGHTSTTERFTFSLHELCERLISLSEACEGHRQTIYNEVPPALMLTGSKSQLQSILLLLLSDAAQDRQAFVNLYAKQTASDGHAWRVGIQCLKVGSPAQYFPTSLNEMDHQSELLPVIKTMTKAVLRSNLTCERVASGSLRGYKRHFGLSSTLLSYTSSVSVAPSGSSSAGLPALLTRSWIVIEAENLRQMSNIKQCLTQLGVAWTTCSADMLKNQTRATQAALVPATLIQHPRYRSTIETYARTADQAVVVVMTDHQSAVDVLASLDDFPMSGLLYENCPVKDVADIVRTVTQQQEVVQCAMSDLRTPKTPSHFSTQSNLRAPNDTRDNNSPKFPDVNLFSSAQQAQSQPAQLEENSKTKFKVRIAPLPSSTPVEMQSTVASSAITTPLTALSAVSVNGLPGGTVAADEQDLDEAQFLAMRKILVDSHWSDSTADSYILESLVAMRSMIALLDEMLLSGDLHGLHAHVHQFIGKAGHLGAPRLSQVLRAATNFIAETARLYSSNPATDQQSGLPLQLPKQTERELARHVDMIHNRFAMFVSSLNQRFHIELPPAHLLHSDRSVQESPL